MGSIASADNRMETIVSADNRMESIALADYRIKAFELIAVSFLLLPLSDTRAIFACLFSIHLYVPRKHNSDQLNACFSLWQGECHKNLIIQDIMAEGETALIYFEYRCREGTKIADRPDSIFT